MGEPTKWPICTRHTGRRNEHVGDEDYSKGSPAWAYVNHRGDAACSCCDPVNGFPCLLDPTAEPGQGDGRAEGRAGWRR